MSPFPTSPGVIASEISLVRQARNVSYSLVEGPSDGKLFQQHLDAGAAGAAVIRHCGNKDTVLRTMAELRRRGMRGVVGIVDADFDRILHRATAEPSVVCCDGHDADVMLMASPAFEGALAILGATERITRCEQARGKSARKMLFDAALPLGRLRLLSAVESMNLSFGDHCRSLRYARFIDCTICCDVTTMVDEVINKSGCHSVNRPQLCHAIDAIGECELGATDVVCGDDLVSIFSESLLSALGNRQRAEVTPTHIREVLWAAFSALAFSSTSCYRDLRSWERDNAPYRIFAA